MTATKIVFPFNRRVQVLEDIADTFASEGFAAGNERAKAWGWTLIVQLAEAGYAPEEIDSALAAFIAAWRAVAIPRMASLPQSSVKP